MRQRMPTITESAAILPQHRKQEKAPKKRQRLQALYVVARGPARYRQEIADLRGVQRQSVAAWCAAYAAGGVDQRRSSQVPLPPLRQRMTSTTWTARHERFQEPRGCAGDTPIRTWLAEQHPVHLSSAGGYALVRGKVHAQPKRPRPAHGKKARQPCPRFTRLAPPCSNNHASRAR
jgi:hypothetical protein